jgi:hypothetical protein
VYSTTAIVTQEIPPIATILKGSFLVRRFPENHLPDVFLPQGTYIDLPEITSPIFEQKTIVAKAKQNQHGGGFSTF